MIDIQWVELPLAIVGAIALFILIVKGIDTVMDGK